MTRRQRLQFCAASTALVSFRSAVENEAYNAAFANLIPRVVNQADLSAVAKIVSPRKIVLAGTVYGAGSVHIEADAAWNVERLSHASE